MEEITSETPQLELANPQDQNFVVKVAPVPVKDKRKGDVIKRKETRSVDQVLKTLNGLNSSEQKFSILWEKYVEAIDENRKLQANSKQFEKTILMLQRERDQCNTEKSKAVLSKGRLENLCRELQKQNKSIKEESLSKLREEEEKRKEVSAKFQSTVAEITTLMAETNDKNVKLLEDNMETQKKFKTVFEEMDLREKHFEGMHKLMKLELQAAEAKLAKVTLEMTEEKETLLMEKNQMLLKLTECQARIRELQAVETNLRSQISMYTDKYEEFQNALTRSNKVFGGFNEEMSKMSKKILKLEKETKAWKSRWEKSNASLLEMAADKQIRDSEISKLTKKCSLLEELCKTFQQERVNLLAELKEKSQKHDLTNENVPPERVNETELQCDSLESKENCVIPATDGSKSNKSNSTACDNQESVTRDTCTGLEQKSNGAIGSSGDVRESLIACPLKESLPDSHSDEILNPSENSPNDGKVVPQIRGSNQSEDGNSSQTPKSENSIDKHERNDSKNVLATEHNNYHESKCQALNEDAQFKTDHAKMSTNKKHKVNH
ncbi:hypothetical protein QAD02_014444 [Eretmocerus hayati]|uniref:Uncharacterized protein n=1 Tax=Eretmocerus hayati TaxID=131215 RepID=A0ACC2P881_9HYME|nr:hypothetical protein QAD02_014444 [Eretmocerus hayati]